MRLNKRGKANYRTKKGLEDSDGQGCFDSRTAAIRTEVFVQSLLIDSSSGAERRVDVVELGELAKLYRKPLDFFLS